MSLEILTDIIAPNSLWEAGVTGRNIRFNRRGENQGGVQRVNIVWDVTKREFTWKTVPFKIDVWQTLEGLYEATDAGGYGFLLQDPKDPSANHTTGRAELISSAPSYQLLKRYTAVGSNPPRTRDRTIRYVKEAGFELKVNGVTQSTPGDYTLDAMTGVVTITAEPSEDAITWSGVFYVPVHFTKNDIQWELVVAGGEQERYFVGPDIVLEEVKE